MTGGSAQPNVRLQDVGVDYHLYHHRSRSLWSRLRGGHEKSGRSFQDNGYAFQALRNVTVSLGPGDRLAVVGANGAGKTTLALVTAGILTPTRGTAETNGIVCSVIGGGAGPHPRATIADMGVYEALRRGRFSREGLRWTADALAFSNSSLSLDTPLHDISQVEIAGIRIVIGMMAGADIFVFDEAISNMNPAFLKKMTDAFAAPERAQAILVVCERAPDAAQGLCRDMILMQNGGLSARMPLTGGLPSSAP